MYKRTRINIFIKELCSRWNSGSNTREKAIILEYIEGAALTLN